MKDRPDFDPSKLTQPWSEWWDRQCKDVSSEWNVGGRNSDEFARGIIYFDTFQHLVEYFGKERRCREIRVFRFLKNGEPAALTIHKRERLPELWCHVEYKGYRNAFTKMVEMHLRLNARPNVPDMFDVDHMFFWKGVEAWGCRYVRMSILPHHINQTWGWTYEKTILAARPRRELPHRPMSWQVLAKTLCAPLPTPDQHYEGWRASLASWMHKLQLWPYDRVKISSQIDVEKLDTFTDQYLQIMFDRGLRWREWTSIDQGREEPYEGYIKETAAKLAATEAGASVGSAVEESGEFGGETVDSSIPGKI